MAALFYLFKATLQIAGTLTHSPYTAFSLSLIFTTGPAALSLSGDMPK